MAFKKKKIKTLLVEYVARGEEIRWKKIKWKL